MTINKARSLLRENINTMTLEQVQRHKVNVLDAWRHSEGEYGAIEAVKEGFWQVVKSEYAVGFVPVDVWLTENLKIRWREAVQREAELLKA